MQPERKAEKEKPGQSWITAGWRTAEWKAGLRVAARPLVHQPSTAAAATVGLFLTFQSLLLTERDVQGAEESSRRLQMSLPHEMSRFKGFGLSLQRDWLSLPNDKKKKERKEDCYLRLWSRVWLQSAKLAGWWFIMRGRMLTATGSTSLLLILSLSPSFTAKQMVCLLSISALYSPLVYKFVLSDSKGLTEHCSRQQSNKVLLERHPYHGSRP